MVVSTASLGHSILLVSSTPSNFTRFQSLASRGYAKEQFSWRHYYFYLTDEGIAYLREYLGFGEEVIPATLKVAEGQRDPSNFRRQGTAWRR